MSHTGEGVPQIPQEYFEAFYGSLVGTKQAAEQVVSLLGAAVALAVREVRPIELFDELHAEAAGLVGRTIQAYEKDVVVGTLPRHGWEALKANAITGVDIAVSALLSAGSLYETHILTNPQRLTVVRRNIYLVHDRIASFAYFPNTDAKLNLTALHLGCDPESDATSLTKRVINIGYPVDYSQGFEARLSHDGQLDLFPKFRKKIGRPGEGRCPGSVARVSEVLGTTSALLAFGRLLGEVALSEIYPRICEVVDDTADEAAAGDGA